MNPNGWPVRRNPRSLNPRRAERGPPPPPDEQEARVLARELKAAMAAWTRRFKQRRGCPAGVHDGYIEVLRRKGAWDEGAYDIPRPDGGPMRLP